MHRFTPNKRVHSKYVEHTQAILLVLLAGLVLLKLTDTVERGTPGNPFANFDIRQHNHAAGLMRAFAGWQKHLLQSVHADSTTLPPVLLVRLPNGGWGNRMPALVTGILMAAFTNRMLMLEANPTFTQHFQLAVGDEWPQVSRLYSTASRCTVDRWRLVRADLDWCLPNTSTSRTVMVYESWDYDVPLLQVNPALRDHLQVLFPAGNVFYVVSKYLLRPTPLVQQAVAAYQHSARSCLVGMHMRTKKPYPLEGRATLPTFPVQLFAGVAQAIAQHQPGSIFVAADDDVFTTVADGLPQRHVWWSTLTQTSVLNNSATGANPGTDLSAVVDMLLLAQCKHLVITSGSTFGFVAAGLADVKPTVIAPYKHDRPFDEPWFWGSVTSEPCMYGVGQGSLHKMPEDVQRALNASHPLYMFHNQCHP